MESQKDLRDSKLSGLQSEWGWGVDRKVIGEAWVYCPLFHQSRFILVTGRVH